MQRLSALDASFLHLENADVQANIGGVSVFEGPAPKQAEVLRRIEAKLAQVPRYRQRVHTLPGHLAAPLWVDDAHFNLGYHVRRTALPKPGDEAELRTLFGRVISQHLDDSKPLWELWVVEGLRGGRWAVLWKVHHAMVDGISARDPHQRADLTQFLDRFRATAWEVAGQTFADEIQRAITDLGS